MSWEGYETLYKGVGDRRLQHVLLIAADAADIADYCAATVVLLRKQDVRVDLVVVVGGDEGLERWPFADVTSLGHRTLELPPDRQLRGELVRQIRRLRPEVVITVDPTPMLRQHPDHRAVARAALDAAWPYAGANVDPEHGPPHRPREVWLYSGPAPDLFVPVDPSVQAELAALGAPYTGREEKFAQVDLRDRAPVFPSG